MRKAVVVLLVALLIVALAAWGYSKIEIMAVSAVLVSICYICFLKAELKKTKDELAKTKNLASQLNSKLMVANRINESLKTKGGNKVVRPKNVKSPNISRANASIESSYYSLSRAEEQFAPIGNFNVYGKDMKLEAAPVSEAKPKAEKIPDFLLADDPMDALCNQIGVSR